MTYTYKCSSCNKEHETEQKVSEKPLKKCPHCGRMSLVRQITCHAFSLTGSCWSRDNYSAKTAVRSK